MGAFLRKYDTATAAGTHIRIPVIKAGSNDFAGSGDWTPAAGDVKVSKNGAGQANIGTLPSYSNGAWEFQLTAAEVQSKTTEVVIVDSATKAVEDQFFIVETFGHASAMYQHDLSDGVRLGLTALPNAAADAAGGLPTTTKITDARLAILTDWIDGGRLDLLLDAIPTTAMRGTDGANTTVPDVAGTAATLHGVTDGKVDVVDGIVDTIATDVAGLDGDAMRGTNSAALATVCTEGRLAELAAANLPADVDAILADTGTGGVVVAAASRVAIVDEVWDEANAGHVAAGTTGKNLSDAGGGADADAIADAVWDEAQAGHVTAATFGAALDAKVSANATAITALTTDIAFLKNVAEGDREIDTDATPYNLVVKTKSTSTELIRKELFQADDSDVTATTHIIAKQTEP